MYDEGYIGEIRVFAGTFVPQDWLLCDGSEYLIGQYQVLAAVIGNIYGGNGRTTFAVPDLCGRAACAPHPSSVLIPHEIGGYTGQETTALTAANIPAHNHTIACNNNPAAGTLNTPVNNYMGAGPFDRSTGKASNTRYATTSNSNAMGGKSLSGVGATSPANINLMQPSLAMLFIICYDGMFPVPED